MYQILLNLLQQNQLGFPNTPGVYFLVEIWLGNIFILLLTHLLLFELTMILVFAKKEFNGLTSSLMLLVFKRNESNFFADRTCHFQTPPQIFFQTCIFLPNHSSRSYIKQEISNFLIFIVFHIFSSFFQTKHVHATVREWIQFFHSFGHMGSFI